MIFANPEFFEVLLLVYCVVSIVLLCSPMYAAAWFIFFRSTCQIAAFKGFLLFNTLPYFIVPGALLAITATVALARTASFRFNRVFELYLLFVLFVSLFGLITLDKPASYFDFVFKLLFPVFIYVLTTIGIRNETDIYNALRLLAYPSLVPLGFGFLQLLLGGGYDYETNRILPGFRIIGTIMDANLYGIFISTLICSLFPLFFKKKTFLVFFFLFLMLASLIFAQNRGSWIALSVALVLTISLFHRYLRIRYWVASGLTILLLSAPIITSRFQNLHEIDQYGQSQDTFQNRINFQSQLLPLSLDSPIIGSGIGVGKDPLSGLLPHNDYLRIAVESGYLCLIIFLGFFIIQYIDTLRFKDSRLWDIQFATHCMIVYIFIISFEENILSDVLAYSMVLYILAIAHRAAALSIHSAKAV